MFLKRILDVAISLVALLFMAPILIPVIILIWLQDLNSPFYFGKRVGLNNSTFFLIKLRSMIINAENSGVDSTKLNDKRITKLGKIIRKYKLDELPQFWNVLRGDMTIVGPRPNVKRETDLYTNIEKNILSVKPGITDIASIIFSDEGEILEPYSDPDIAYNQLIRPRKSKLSLFYINNSSIILDLKLILFTAIAIVNKKLALKLIVRSLRKIGASEEILNITRRSESLLPEPPPGSDKIVTKR